MFAPPPPQWVETGGLFQLAGSLDAGQWEIPFQRNKEESDGKGHLKSRFSSYVPVSVPLLVSPNTKVYTSGSQPVGHDPFGSCISDTLHIKYELYSSQQQQNYSYEITTK